MSKPAHILIIEDNEPLARSLRNVLRGEGYAVETRSTADDGLATAQTDPYDVVVTDLQLPGTSPLDDRAGFNLITQLHAARPHLPIILMTAHHTTETAIEATKLGAYDYLLKPFEPTQLLDLVAQAVAGSRVQSEPVEIGLSTSAKDAIIGQSRAMQNVYKEIGRLAARPVTVLIRGETGTGKELVARALFQHSERAHKPFVVVNCVAIPETLLESEIFGHEPGSFTGATTRRIGRFEQAHQGTIFLDEIGDMTLSTQAKLLRVLQEKTIQRLGSRDTIPVDVRVIAATHRDLEAAIDAKQFRDDLYYRLNVACIILPPLRDRREDIPALVHYFLRRYGAELGAPNSVCCAKALQYLQQQPWTGNVRELENVVRKSLLLARGLTIAPEHVQQAYAQSNPPRPGTNQTLTGYIAEMLDRATHQKLENVHAALIEVVERELYAQAIELAKGNQVRAAKWLGVSRPTMREKLIQFGLHPSRSIDESS